MKLLDIIKKTGSSIIRDVVPGGGILIDAVNTLLPDNHKLPSTASGRDVESAIGTLPPEQRAALLERQFDVDEALIKARGDVIVAEAQGDSWLQRSWRPITMLTLVALLSSYMLGLTDAELPEAVVVEVMEIIKLGLGGYVIGRTAEKVVKSRGGVSGVIDRFKK